MTPPDLAALARVRKLIAATESTVLLRHQGKTVVGVAVDREKCGLARLLTVFDDLLDVAEVNAAALTLSRTAGRAEGLDVWTFIAAVKKARRETRTTLIDLAQGLCLSPGQEEELEKFFRALASDPAPGDRMAEERRAIADEARRYAGHYPQASDGRNTFILLAEWIESRGSAPAHPTEPGAQSESFSPETTNNENPFPAHPTEPGEVERLKTSLTYIGRLAQPNDKRTADGAIRSLELVYDTCVAALSTPQPKGETE